MCIGFVFHIVKTPVGNLPSHTHLSASAKLRARTIYEHEQAAGTKTRDTKNPAEHPVRGLKPVHHL